MLENCVKKGDNPVNYYLLYFVVRQVSVWAHSPCSWRFESSKQLLNSYGGIGRRARLKILSE